MTKPKSLKVAILGSGNIGSDLMVKLLRLQGPLKLCAMAGIDSASHGLARAKAAGIATTAEGVKGLFTLSACKGLEVVFDATSAKAHIKNNEILKSQGIRAIDLTAAAIGPQVVPPVNLGAHQQAQNINLVTCGGQATIPIVAAVNAIVPVIYAEIVSSIASRSAGPGTRANIDEFTRTTARALETIGGAKKGKAIIILNPAEPPLMMRNTVFCVVAENKQKAIENSILKMIAGVAQYVPGFQLKQAVQFDTLGDNRIKVTVFLEVAGAADYLPAYAGNLDIMTSAAIQTAQSLVEVA